MQRKGGSSGGSVLPWIGLLGIITLFVLGVIGPMPKQVQSVQAPSAQNGQAQTTGGSTTVNAFATSTVNVVAINTINGSAVTNADAYLFAGTPPVDGQVTPTPQTYAANVNVNSALTTVTTAAPTTLNGYLLIGNDNVIGTNRAGTSWYYRAIPVNYNNQGVYTAYVKLYPQASSLTFTGYADGVSAGSGAVLNVTVGTTPVTSSEIKLEVPAQSAFGNPDLTNPIGVCFNVTTMGNWNSIAPSNYVGTFNRPKVLQGYNVVGSCYILPTAALADDGGAHNTFYRFYFKFDPAANPPNEAVKAFFFDKTYYLDDNGVPQIGWAYDSAKGTSQDPGFSAINNVMSIVAY